MLAKIIKEYNLVIDISLIRLAMNKADALIRVQQWWLTSAQLAAIAHSLNSKRIMSIH